MALKNKNLNTWKNKLRMNKYQQPIVTIELVNDDKDQNISKQSMPLDDKNFDTLENKIKINKHQQPIVTIELVNDDVNDEKDKHISKQQTTECFGKRSFCVFENDTSVEMPEEKRSRLSSTSTDSPKEKDGSSNCSTNEKDKFFKSDVDKSDALLSNAIIDYFVIPFDEDYAQTVFDEIINYITLSYVDGKEFQNDEENEVFWSKVHPNHQKVILQKIDDVRDSFIKYLNSACKVSNEDIWKISPIMTELLEKINIVNKDLELEVLKQIIS